MKSPEFGAQLVPIPAIDGVEHLIGLLERVRFDRFERLFAIPRTAARSPQPGHDLDQPLKLLTGAV